MRKVVVIAKPESVALGLEAFMEDELEELGLKIVDCRSSGQLTEDEARQLYDELRQDGRSWYEDAVRAILRGPVVVFLVEGGDDAVTVIKEWRGPTFDADQTDSFRGRMIREYGTGEDESLRAATNYVHSSGGDKEARHEAEHPLPRLSVRRLRSPHRNHKPDAVGVPIRFLGPPIF